jgi:signal transduction histidine kinase
MVQGTMNVRTDASVSKAKLPEALVWAVVVVCVVPFLLNLAGVDFATQARVFEPVQGLDTPSEKVIAALHHTLKVSFTHTILEWSAFCTAIFTVFLAFVHFHITRDVTTLVIGVALFFAGTMDAFHILAADRLLETVIDSQNFIPFTWTVCRLFNVFIMMTGAGLCLATQGSKWQGSPGIAILASILFGGIAYLITHNSVASARLPQMIFPDAIVTRPYDAIPLVLFLITGAFVYPRLYQRVPSLFSHALIISIVPNVAAQLHMAFGSGMLFDAHFNMAHFLKMISYLVPFSGLALDYIRAYREEERTVQRLTEAREALVERSAQLEKVNADLVRRNSELDEFNYVVSHDLQEPVRTLMAFSDHLRKDLGLNLPDRAAQDVGFIVDTANRMQTLIQDLLKLSSTGRTDMKCEWVCLTTCVKQVLETLAIRVQETGATITCDPLPTVWGDPVLLRQMYQNLIDNALKFVNHHPPEIRLTAEPHVGHWILGVQDHGIGLKPEFTEQIFLPFKRLHGRAQYAGTGIGLAICRKAVERHGGRIWVESQVDEGAHFRFMLAPEPQEA